MATVMFRRWNAIAVVSRQWKPIAAGVLLAAVEMYAINKVSGDHPKWWWWIVLAVALVGLLVCGLWGVLSERADSGQEAQQEREKADAARQRAIAGALRMWPALSVRDTDPHQIGVARSPKADAYRKDGSLIAPYVDRDVDTRRHDSADERLRRSGLILLIGVPASGVTRTAYQLARRAVPDAMVLAPSGPRGLKTAIDNDVLGLFAPRAQVLLWLDRIDKSGEDGPSVAMLRQLRKQSPGLRVIATIPSGDRYLRWVADNADVADEFGEPLTVERLPVSAAELQRAQSLYPELDFSEGIAAAFTTVSSLLQLMRAGNSNCDHDSCAGDCALTRAVVAVAMDWVGTGTPRPQPIDRVSSLVQQRLTLPEPPDPIHLASAVRWAATPVDEGESLLRSDARDGSTWAVIAHPQIAEIASRQPAEAVWTAALDDAVAANDSDAIGRIGFRAHVGDHLEIAKRVWAKVTSDEEPAAQWLLEAAKFSRRRRDPTATHILAEERLLELAEAAHGPDARQVVTCLCSLGAALLAHKQPREALAPLERARRIIESKVDVDQSNVAGIYANMGNAWAQLGRADTARDLDEKAVAIYKQLFGDESPQVAQILTNIGNACLSLDDPNAARQHHEQALAINKQTFGDESPKVGIDLINLGDTWIQLDDADMARGLYEQALPIIREEFGSDHVYMASLLVGLGDARLKLHRPDSARDCYERALAIRRRKFGDESPDVARALVSLGHAHRALGEYQTALDNLNQALPILEREFGADHRILIPALQNMAHAWNALGDMAKARSYYEWLLRALEKRFGNDDPQITRTLNDIATTWIAEGELDKAREALARGLGILHRHAPRGQDTMDLLRRNMSIADPDAIILDDGQILHRSNDAGDNPTPDGLKR
jgi:tetratricopeptide (TPR) repeat protein